MNYHKKENRKYFVDYWNSEVSKKLFRCSKEFGFYHVLKKVLKSDYSYSRNEIIYKSLVHLLNDLYDNKKEIIDFSHLLDKQNRLRYPVYTALTSKIHLSHLVTLCLLRKCNLSHQLTVDAFEWMTVEIFKENRCKARWNEIRAYIKLFFT